MYQKHYTSLIHDPVKRIFDFAKTHIVPLQMKTAAMDNKAYNTCIFLFEATILIFLC
jgi:hypothetical protein